MARGVGVRDVVWFNWPTYAAATIVTVTALFALGMAVLPPMLAWLVALGALLATWWTLASIAAAAWVFGGSGVTHWAWIPDRLGHPSTWLNITSGFDDTTSRLREALPGTVGTSLDLFDPEAAHDGALRRARASFPPTGASKVTGRGLPIDDLSHDAVFLLMAAHELEAAEVRTSTFREIARVLRPNGRLLVVEFPANRLNLAIFGPGWLHFEPSSTWAGFAERAGLQPRQAVELTPFVRGFVFEKSAA